MEEKTSIEASIEDASDSETNNWNDNNLGPLIRSGLSLSEETSKIAKKWEAKPSKNQRLAAPAEDFQWKNIKTCSDLAKLIDSDRVSVWDRKKAFQLAETINDDAKGLSNWIDKSKVMDFVQLARSQKLQHYVVDNFTTALAMEGRNPQVAIDLLKGLYEAVYHVVMSKRDQDNLINLYQTLYKFLAKLHAENPAPTNIIFALRGLSQITDALVNSGFDKMNSEALQQPVYDILQKLIKHTNPEIAFLAKYCQQGLLRIPNDVKKSDKIAKRCKDIFDVIVPVGLVCYKIIVIVGSGGLLAPLAAGIPLDVLNIYRAGVRLSDGTTVKREIWFDLLMEVDRRLSEINNDDLDNTDYVASQHNNLIKQVDEKLEYEYYTGLVYRLVELTNRFPELLDMEDFVQSVFSLFKALPEYAQNHSSCSLALGRAAIFVRDLINKEKINVPSFNTYLTEVAETFTSLMPKTDKKMDVNNFQKAIYYAFILMFFSSNDKIIEDAWSFLDTEFRHMDWPGLAKIEVTHDNGKTNDHMKIEIMNCLAILLTHGSNNVKTDLKGKIDTLILNCGKENEKSNSSKKAYRMLKKHNLDKIERFVAPDFFELTKMDNCTSNLLRSAKEKYRRENIDYSEICSHLLNSKAEQIGLLQSGIERDYDEQELYIPLLGKVHNEADTNAKDLEQSVDDFLTPTNDQKMLLITGNTGSGKSMFAINYATKKARICAESGYDVRNNYVPIFVSLVLLKKPGTKLISESLVNFSERGYKVSPNLLGELRNCRTVFILDGYDEMSNNVNLYIQNRLSEWPNAKFIIFCRSQWLVPYGEDISQLFSTDGHSNIAHFDIVKFDTDHIKRYIDNYLDIRRPKLKNESPGQRTIRLNRVAKEYFTFIDEKMRGLKDMVTTPFHLRITMVLMTDLMGLYEENPSDEIGMLRLYERYMRYHFNRQVEKIMLQGNEKQRSIKNMVQKMDAYCKDLVSAIKATLLDESKPAIIRYDGSDKASVWHKFFNETDETKALRSACPLRSCGKYEYQLLHKVLLEYFLFKIGCDPMQYYSEQATKQFTIGIEGNDKKEVSQTDHSAFFIK